MFFSEIGQFHTTYEADAAILRLRQHAMALAVLAVVAFGVVPLAADDYWLTAILTPFLILSLAGIGLNMLTGYAGQLSVGTAGFMSVGAHAAWRTSGCACPACPSSPRYSRGASRPRPSAWLPVSRARGSRASTWSCSTLAVQFFVEWLFTRFRWFSNDNAFGAGLCPSAARGGREPRDARRALPADARYRRRDDAPRREHRPQRPRSAVDGRAGHGHRRGGHRHSGTPGQARGFCRQLLLLRRRRRPVGNRVPGQLRPARLRSQPLVPGALHHHRRRPGDRLGGLPGSGLHGPSAHRDEPRRHGALSRRGRSGRPRELARRSAFGVLIVVVLVKEPGGLAKILQRLRAQARVWPLRAW